MSTFEKVPSADAPELAQILEFYELLHSTVHSLGKYAITILKLDEHNKPQAEGSIKTFLTPGALTEWAPSDASNLPSGLAIMRERRFAAGLFSKSHGQHKLVVNEMDSVRNQRPEAAGGSDEYHTAQRRYRFVWNANDTLLTSEVRPVDIYSDTTLRGWGAMSAIAKVKCASDEPFRFDHGWQEATASDVDGLIFRTDEFRRELLERRVDGAA